MDGFDSLPPAMGRFGIGFLESSAHQPGLVEHMQNRLFLLVGVLDGAVIIAAGTGPWFASAHPFK